MVAVITRRVPRYTPGLHRARTAPRAPSVLHNGKVQFQKDIQQSHTTSISQRANNCSSVDFGCNLKDLF